MLNFNLIQLINSLSCEEVYNQVSPVFILPSRCDISVIFMAAPV